MFCFTTQYFVFIKNHNILLYLTIFEYIYFGEFKSIIQYCAIKLKPNLLELRIQYKWQIHMNWSF